MEKKKKNNICVTVLIVLFIAYIAFYISVANGYYDYLNYNKKMLTEEAIKRFEEDVSNGLDVTMEEYLINTYTDYSNGISRIGIKASNSSSKIMKKGISKTFGVINALLSD